MPNKISFIYWDSSVFLSYINGIPDRVKIISQLFEEVEKDENKRILTSAFTKVEVAHTLIEKQRKKLDPQAEASIDLLWANPSVVEIVDFHDDIALLARKLIRDVIEEGRALKPADALHLASAKWVGVSEFFTYDAKLHNYSPIVGFTICDPYVTQQKLL